jgi:hypothetical protein
MMARWLGIAMLSVSLFGSGCCCMPCGPCGQPACCFCLPHLPKPIVWDGCCNECGPNNCSSCAGYCNGGCQTCGIFGHGGIFHGLGGCMSCGKGCSDIYINEWISDPPDCCDPCDKCCGEFTGPHGYCCRGPFQRILSALHCYKYCPPPDCGPWKPIFGHCGCGNCGNYGASCGCGDIGCSTCAGGAYSGGGVYDDGQPSQVVPRPTPINRTPQAVPAGPGEPTSILNENWDAPRVKPEPGKPIHNAQQPRGQISGRYSPQQLKEKQLAQQQAQRQPAQIAQRQSASQQPQRLAAAQVTARRAALQRRAEANADDEDNVRGATYQR